MSDFDGSLSAIMANLFHENRTKTAFIPCILASALIFSYTSADLVLNQTDLVEYVKTDKSWEITFETILSMTTAIISPLISMTFGGTGM